MGVRMTHPDVDGEIVVTRDAAPIHANSGWTAVPGQDDMGATLPPEVARFEGQDAVRLRHPDVAEEITVGLDAVPWHRAVGWVEVDAAERQELEAKTVEELKDEARGRGLAVSGTKAELIERLTEEPTHDEPDDDQQPAEPATQEDEA